MDKRTATGLGTLAAMMALAVVSWAVSSGGPDPQSSSAQPSSTYSVIADPSNVSGLPCATASRLPPQARDTLELIDGGGPFRFEQDDSVFANYEGLLPDEPRGYYHEYTVITPGEDDRGARRIIAGENGAEYYTADHYATFVSICSP